MASSRKNSTSLTEFRKESALNSAKYLREVVPAAEERIYSEVEKILGDGSETHILGLFYNSDGSLRKDASVKLMNMLFAEDEIKAKDSIINEYEAALKKGTFGSYTPAAKRGGSSGEGVPTETATKLRGLTEYMAKKTYS